MTERGTAMLVLHTHLPYCRLAGRWPHGEEWFHEAMLECYLPLLSAFRELQGAIAGSFGVTINVTPILAEQMRDPLMQEHFRAYVADRCERAASDVARFATNEAFGATAAFHLERYRAAQALFEAIEGDVPAALAQLEAAGHVEIATSAATHGYLPLLGDDDAVRFQVETGVAAHIRTFGRPPRSFWLPECAYRPGLERILEDAGIRVFFVETHLVTGGKARGKARGGVVGLYPESSRTAESVVELPPLWGTTFEAYTVGSSRVAALARNERTGLQVWSASHGYPGDGRYREFHKKDDESGLHYWRVTGPGAGLGDKQPYDPAVATALARDHAAHFANLASEELDAYRASAGKPGALMTSYDTELFGHWWLEGVPWLRETILQLAAMPGVRLTTTGSYVVETPPAYAIELPEGSWGNGGDHRTWLNPTTAWTWPEIRARQARAAALLRTDNAATRQLARELLLLQSSDWQFLMTTGQAHDYAIERFKAHLARFDMIAGRTESGDDDKVLAEIERLDNPFPDIQPTRYARRER
ncbi:MAG: 1,4-alpha-glucan branching protein domain-containing protein [Dehalococcoidia bacterium]